MMTQPKQCRDINKLKWNFLIKAKAFFEDVRVEDKIFLVETFRTQELQDYYLEKWLSKIKRSLHQDWKAFDIAFYGSELYPNDISRRRYIADVAKEYKIDWGYDLWKWDKPHYQCNWETYITKRVTYNANRCNTNKADLSKKIIQYEQSKNWCWLYSNITALSHARGIEFDKKELKRIEKYANEIYNREYGKWNNPFVWAEIMLSYIKDYYPNENIVVCADNILKSKKLVKAFLNWHSIVIMTPWHATTAYFDYNDIVVRNVNTYEDSRNKNIKDYDNFLDSIKNWKIEEIVLVYYKK